MRTFAEDEQGSIANTVNLTPLIDMVFILLIFFIVTSSFVKESGVDVSRPQAHTTTTKERSSIVVGVTADGAIWIDNQQIDLRSVRVQVERLHAENPEGEVIIVADAASETGLVISVLDQARLAGVAGVSIAASRPSQ